MTRGNLIIGNVVLSIIIILLLVLLTIAHAKIEEARIRPNYSRFDIEIIDLAYASLARELNTPVHHLRLGLYPRVIHFPDKSCVQLTPDLRSVGVSHVFCFARDSNALVERHIGR